MLAICEDVVLIRVDIARGVRGGQRRCLHGRVFVTCVSLNIGCVLVHIQVGGG